MKTILLLSLIVFPVISFGQCNKKIDPSKVILFIDTNTSDPEIATAEKAACERGERIVIIPKNYKDYKTPMLNVEKAEKAFNSCRKNKKDCAEAEKNAHEAHQVFNDFKAKQPGLANATQIALEEIKSQKGKIQSLLISGHDGGGTYSGLKGSFGRVELLSMMKNFKDINEVKSLMLLGCYTGVEKEIFEWKKIFPDVRLIAGYDKSAPLSDKPLGHQYISDILLKEKTLVGQSDDKKLLAYSKANLQSLFQLNSAVYVNCDPLLEKEFYYKSSSKNKQFSTFDIKDCLNKDTEAKKLAERITKYYEGEIEPPTDTANGELRQIYNQARAMEHCLDILGGPFEVNVVFNLLFYESVKKNFAKYYKDDLAQAEKVIAGLNLMDMEKNFQSEQKKLQDKLNHEKKMIELLTNNPDEFFKIKAEEIEKFKKSRQEFLAKYPFLRNVRIQDGDLMSTPDSFSEHQEALAEKYAEMFSNLFDMEKALKIAKTDRKVGLANLRNDTDYMEEYINHRSQEFNSFKKDPQILKDLWVPTAKNLAKYSRDDLMKNQHSINKLLTLSGTNAEQKRVLDWLESTTSSHLRHFENPFSWHEYNSGTVEIPQSSVRLKDFTEREASSGVRGVSGGMMGGATSGFR